MSRRGHVWTWTAAGMALAAGLTVLASTRATRRPNVVVILVDTLRADHLTVYGYARPTAPFLSQLAAEGVVFEHAWSTSGWTAPATASLFTSLYPEQHGVVRRLDPASGRVNRIPPEAQTIAEALRAGGYRTFGVSDNVIVAPEMGFDQGFDVFEASSGASVERVNKWVRDHRADLEAGQPYFLYLHYMEPHEPYPPHEPWFRQFSTDGLAGDARPRHFVAAYDSEIRALDDSLARLHRTMGWDANTIVVVTSDHGEEFGDHGGGGHAHSLFAELLHVPLVFHSGDRRFAPGRVDEPVSLVDVLPTLRGLLRLPAGPHDEGVSLAGLLAGRREGFDRPLFAHLEQFATGRVWSATLEGEWKRIHLAPGGAMLFNLADDPADRHDLLADGGPGDDALVAAARLSEEAERLAARLGAPPEPVTVTPDAATLEELRALGYTR
jgi:arylsulfatase A-like enzyme